MYFTDLTKQINQIKEIYRTKYKAYALQYKKAGKDLVQDLVEYRGFQDDDDDKDDGEYHHR